MYCLIHIDLSFFGGGSGGGGFPNTQGGRGNSKIHKDRQDKHVEGSKNYNQQIQNGKNPSILTENSQQLLKEGAGKGLSHGANKEVVDYGRTIGKYYHQQTGRYHDTTRATIHYDGKGNAHIVPAAPNWMIEK